MLIHRRSRHDAFRAALVRVLPRRTHECQPKTRRAYCRRAAHGREQGGLAAKALGPVGAGPVRVLAHRRNESDRQLGARDYFALTLATSELDEDRLFATLAAVDDATRAPFAAWKESDDLARAERFTTTPEALRPWHYDDPFFQSAPRTDDLDLDRWFAGADLVAPTRDPDPGTGIATGW